MTKRKFPTHFFKTFGFPFRSSFLPHKSMYETTGGRTHEEITNARPRKKRQLLHNTSSAVLLCNSTFLRLVNCRIVPPVDRSITINFPVIYLHHCLFLSISPHELLHTSSSLLLRGVLPDKRPQIIPLYFFLEDRKESTRCHGRNNWRRNRTGDITTKKGPFGKSKVLLIKQDRI